MTKYQSNFVTTALCLRARDIDALAQGRSIATIAETFIRSGQQFALCPDEAASLPLLIKSQQLALLPSSETQQLAIQSMTLSTWAKCERCQILDASYPIEKLSAVTHWTAEELHERLRQKQHLFLAYLRIFQFPHPVEVLATLPNVSKVGKFIGLPNSQTINDFLPVLSDRIFSQRKHKLENLEPPAHPELEALHSAIAQLTLTHPNAIHLEQDLKCFLGWAESLIVDRTNTDKIWIQEIAKAGNSSDGDYFEKLVRKSFIELGFTNSRNNPKMSLDPDVTGGAGGIDFFCDAPYLVIGECKASKDKKVNDNKDGAPAQLIKHGNAYLTSKEFDNCIRIIMAPGKLTEYADRTASGNKMNVLQPETLQRLVDLKQAYPGAINLWELKSCLAQAPFSQAADDKVNQFIDRARLEIEVRSRIVQLLQSRFPQELGTDFIWGTYEALNPPRSLTKEELKDILIELSSPLTGFIGRKDSDRFYFLRSLNLDSSS